MDTRSRPRPARARRRGVQAALLAAAALLAPPGVLQAQTDPLQFLPQALPIGFKGESYLTQDDPPQNVLLQVTGGLPPYSFELRDGAPPPGITLGPDGSLTGVPTACGTAVFQAAVRDAAGGFATGTFALPVQGPAALSLPSSLTPAVEAGVLTTIPLDLVNTGCTEVSFDTLTIDQGPLLPPASLQRPEAGGLAALLDMGAPVPRALGRREAVRRLPGEGWHLDAAGRLVDGEGNVGEPGALAPTPEGLVEPQQGGLNILYVNESATTGEVERLTGLGHTVVQAMVPEALSLVTLQGFDVLWLTAATDSIFPSATAVRRFIWEGGGLVIEQAQISGVPSFLPSGYGLSSLVAPPAGDNGNLAFTLAGGTDPLSQGLSVADLPTNFDSTFVSGSGARWSWLATRADDTDIGVLATAALGAGRLVYHSGNLGTRIIPGARRGSDVFVERVLESAASGGLAFSCPWMIPQGGRSDVRIEQKVVRTVRPVDTSGETVSLQLEVDTRALLPGDYGCDVHLLTNAPDLLELTVPVTLTVTDPPQVRILNRELPHAEPGAPYGGSVLAAGGSQPYTFALVGGSLPTGLNLDPGSGAIFGTPSQAGLFAPTVRVTDAGGAFHEATLTLDSGFVITTRSLPDATIGQVYAVPVFATGGTPPYTFRLDDPIDYQLPATDPGSPAGQACVTTDLGGGSLSTQCTLPGGTYRLLFDLVAGHFPPASRDVEVTAGAATLVDGTYAVAGSVTVNSNLDTAFYELVWDTPQGRIERVGSGMSTTFPDLPPGDYTVSFGVLQGFATPPDQSGTLVDGGSLVFTGNYVSVTPPPFTDAGSAAPITRATLADVGFGTGTLTVTTNVAGAGFRLLANRQPTGLTFSEPAAGPGNGAALVGRMTTSQVPVLSPGQKVPLAVIAEDSAGNRARRVFNPTVWSLPILGSIAPFSATPGMELDLRVSGTALSPSATLSLGPDVTVDTGTFEIVGPGGPSLGAVVSVDPLAVASIRDLVYTDPRLADTAAGSVARLPSVFQIFVGVGRADLDASGRVDGFDLAALAAAFGQSSGDPGFDPARDLDRDGDVDGDDLFGLAIAFGRRTLEPDPATLPAADATLGVAYSHRIGFNGGNLFLLARILGGDVPDGLDFTVEAGSDPPDTSELVLSGIPAETGTFTIQMQVVDAFFALTLFDVVITVNP